CASDRRVTYAVLTATGRAKLQEAADSHITGVRTFFEERFSADEIETLARLLGRLPGAGEAVDEASCSGWPPRRRIRSSFSRVSGSSVSRRWCGGFSLWVTASRSPRKVADDCFCTSRPDVPRTATSEETRQTTSVSRFSAARRSSIVSAFFA